MQCNETDTVATIIGTGTFGTGPNEQDVTYTLIVDDPNNTYQLIIENLQNQLVFSTGANPVVLTGQGVMVRSCPLGPNGLG